jgi:hypothetical protein
MDKGFQKWRNGAKQGSFFNLIFYFSTPLKKNKKFEKKIEFVKKKIKLKNDGM